MRFSNQGRLCEQVRFLRRQYLQDGALPFSDILTDDSIRQAMNALDGVWKDRIYTPLVTLWVFLTQVLSADHSCRGAVARFIAHRLSQGQSLLPGDRCLLSGQKAIARNVLCGRDLSSGTCT